MKKLHVLATSKEVTDSGITVTITAVFNLVSKVMWGCFGFCDLLISRHLLNQSSLSHSSFPALGTEQLTYIIFQFSLAVYEIFLSSDWSL